MAMQKSTLRQQMKAKRLALTPSQQVFASLDIVPKSLALIEQYQAQHIAFYLPFKGEISPLVLMDHLLEQGKSIYLPVLHPFAKGHLLFIQYDPQTALQAHQFGMQQPKLDVRKVKPVEELEMIFTPLLAYDKDKNRLGYGGGFYDRTFAAAPHAIRVGLAHQCQQIEQLPAEIWDIPLHHLVIGLEQ